MKSTHLRQLCGGTSSLLAIMLAAPAMAQTPADADDSTEIVVTAQKRSQALRDVPLAITAVSGDRLQQLGIADTRDLMRIEPSFKYSEAQYGTPVYTIRGVGFNDYSLNATPTVSVYTDELPMSYPVMTKGSGLDLERTEIIKGPQGILFGQNSTGGAINNIAAKPTKVWSAGFTANVERFARADLTGFVSGPLNDAIRFRAAVGYAFGGAWQKSYTRDEKAGAADLFRARTQLELDVSERLRVRFTVSGFVDKSEPTNPHLDGIYLNRAASRPVVPFVVNYALAPAGNNRAADWDPGQPSRNNDWFVQPSMRAEYEISDDVTLTSITGYAFYRDKSYRANDGMAIENNEGVFNQSNESWYQELRLSGQAVDNRLNWLLGGQYSSEDTFVRFLRSYPQSSPAFAAPPSGRARFRHDDKVKTKAVFGNLDFDISDKLTVHAGARYTDYSIRHQGCTVDDDGNLALLFSIITQRNVPPGSCITVRQDFTSGLVTSNYDDNNLSWRAGLDWKPNDDTLIYASVTRGYKAAVIQSAGVTTNKSLDPVKAEKVTSFELGWKASLVDRKVELNGAIFYYDYSNKQLQGREPDPFGVFGNLIKLVAVPKTRLQGAEATMILRPVTGLTASGSLTYLHSKVTSDFLNFDSYGKPLNFKGQPFPFTPKWSLSGDLEYRTEIGGDKVGFVGLSGNYQSSTVSAFGGRSTRADLDAGFVKGTTRLVIPSYATFDLRAGVELHDGKYRLMVYGKNITNKYYVTDVVYQNDTVASRTGKPAVYGVSGSFRF